MSNSKGFTEANVPKQTGKSFIVTGANAGVGFEIARVLAARGARVLLGCREQTKAQDAIARIKRITPNADLVWLPLDLGDLDSVRTAAEIASKEPRIDALINNAGIMNPPLMRTKQGFESQFGVNHLGVFALTSLLLPKLAQTPGSRVSRARSIGTTSTLSTVIRRGIAMVAASWPMRCSSSNWIVACARQGHPSQPSVSIRVSPTPASGGRWGRPNWRGRSSACSSTVLTKAHGRRCLQRREE